MLRRQAAAGDGAERVSFDHQLRSVDGARARPSHPAGLGHML